jgi:hypothetical protein
VMQCMAAEGLHRHVTWRTNEFVPGSALTCARLPHEQSGSWPVATQGQHSRSAAYFNTSDLGSATMTRKLAAPHPMLSGRCNSAYTCDACSAWRHHRGVTDMCTGLYILPFGQSCGGVKRVSWAVRDQSS